MPIRIGASYLVLYWLMARYLFSDKFRLFFAYYFLVILMAGILQRILTYYYYDLLFASEYSSLWSVSSVVRSTILVNSTVLFLSALKMYDYWRQERVKENEEEVLEIRSDKRNFRVRPSEILFVEGLGNYVTFYLEDKKPIISYQKLKELETILPSQFYRIHKSFIINEDKVNSYSSENIEINDRMIPVGKNIQWPRKK